VLDLEAILTNGSHEIRVDRALIDSDVGAFERALANERPEKALILYRADFLQGFHVTGCPAFDVWMEERRAELSWKAFSASQNLAHQAEDRRDRPSALHWWRRSLSLRPYDESVMRRIMLLLSGGDNRGRALAEFERFRRRMSMDLGLDPSEETLAFARSLATVHTTPASQWVGDRRRADRLSRAGDGGERVHWRRMSDCLPH
jgi:DNA-binding SARP family transcriptional activator